MPTQTARTGDPPSQRGSEAQPFAPLRNFLWPVHHFELKKLLPMLLLFFLITFIYNLLRPLKVVLMVSLATGLPSSGAGGSVGSQVIPYLKLWAVFPCAVFMTFLFTRLVSWFNREQVFYLMLSLFLGFFGLFAFVLYPFREALHWDSAAYWFDEHLSGRFLGLQGLVAVIRYWPETLFYVLAEVWSTVVLSMLFWGFANEVTSVDEAKRFYAIFALGANSSGILSGMVSRVLTNWGWKLHEGAFFDGWRIFSGSEEAFHYTLPLHVLVAILCGLFVMGLFWGTNRWIIRPGQSSLEIGETQEGQDALEGPPAKISLSECFAYLLKTPYVLCIAVIVAAYNLVYNLSDVLYTEELRKLYADPQAMNYFMNQVTTWTGVVAVISAFLISGNVIRFYGWTAAALITPLIWLVTSIGFFGAIAFRAFGGASTLQGWLHVPVDGLILWFGATQMCLGRATKYTVFDETKEIVFIPLGQKNKRQAKAVVDGITSRFGKSGGSLIYQILLVFFGSVDATAPFAVVSILCLVAIGFWIYSVLLLGRMVNYTIDKGTETHRPSEDTLEGRSDHQLNTIRHESEDNPLLV